MDTELLRHSGEWRLESLRPAWTTLSQKVKKEKKKKKKRLTCTAWLVPKLLLARQVSLASLCLSFLSSQMAVVTVLSQRVLKYSVSNTLNTLNSFLSQSKPLVYPWWRPPKPPHQWWLGWERRHRRCCWDTPVWWSQPQEAGSSGNAPSHYSWGWAHWENGLAHLWESAKVRRLWQWVEARHAWHGGTENIPSDLSLVRTKIR